MKMTQSTLLAEGEKLAARCPMFRFPRPRRDIRFHQGNHNLKKSGVGHDFWQYRPMVQDDNVRLVDWRQSAKSDTLYIREKEKIIDHPLIIWCDSSPSMRFSSKKRYPLKGERARILAMAMAFLGAKAGEPIASIGRQYHAYHGRTGLYKLAQNLLTEDINHDFPDVHSIPSGSMLMLISDFWFPIKQIEKTLYQYRQKGISGACIRILDPKEKDFGYKGRTFFKNNESDVSFLVNNSAELHRDYKVAFEAHQQALKKATNDIGWPLFCHQTNEDSLAFLQKSAPFLAQGENSFRD